MNNILMAFIISSIAGLSTMLGALIIFLNISKKNINKFITFCLAFSLSIMISISITDLIPKSTYIIISNYLLFKGVFICIIAFIIGMILINILNRMIRKVGESSLYKLGILSMIALLLHNLPEGVATFMSSYQDINLGLKLALAISLHNIPEGICIAVPLYYATHSKLKAFKNTLISGLSEPFGALLAYIFLSKYITDSLISIILIFVAGIMITLSINKLYPEAHKYKENKYLLLGLICGVIMMIINIIFSFG